MKNILKTLFTGKDNSTYDIGRVLWAVGLASLIILECFKLFLSLPFDAMAYAGAIGTILTTGSAALGLKRHTEPETSGS